MSSVEKIPPVSGVVVNETPEMLPAANAENFLSPDDLKRNGWWENKEGVRFRVDTDKITLTEYSPHAHDEPMLCGSLEEIAQKFQTEGFTFFPIDGEGTEKNVIQVPVHEENVPKETASDPDLEKRLAEDRQLDEKIDQSIKEAEAIAKKINGFISEANTFLQEEGFEAIRVVLDDITSQAEGKIELVNNVSVVDDTVDAGVAIDEAHIEAKQQRFEKLQELCSELDTLSEYAARALQSLQKLSAQAKEHDQEVPAIISGSDGDASGKLEKGSGKGDKPGKRERKGKGGKGGGSGSDGGDDANLSPKDVRAARKEIKRARLLQEEAGQQAGSVPVSTVDATTKEVPASEVPSAEPVVAEIPPIDTSWRKELDAFLSDPERLKAQEKVAMFEDIIREEWDEFSGYTHKESLKIGSRLSRQGQMALWQDKGLPALEEMVARHLNTFDSIDLEEGRKIFRAILRNLEEEAKKES